MVPQSYQQWLDCFELLSKNNVSAGYIEALEEGSCPGIDHLAAPFEERVQATVNQMLKRYTGMCTRSLNEALEEGDFSEVDVLLRRQRKNMNNCRFYRYIPFLRRGFQEALDAQVSKEIERYWREMKKYLSQLVEETESADLYDIIYYIKRLGY